MRFQKPDQLRGPFASLWHLAGISEGEGLFSAGDSFLDRPLPADDVLGMNRTNVVSMGD